MVRRSLRYTVLFYFVTIISPFLLNAADDAQGINVDGWGKTKGGMSIDEVKTAIGKDFKLKEEKVQANDFPKIVCEGIEIAGEQFTACLGFEDSSKLTYVLLGPVNKEKNNKYFFDNLKNLLTVKYGKPATEDNNDFFKISTWSAGKTKIELSLLASMGNLKDVIHIKYEPLEKATKDL
jgi:hypothetical protein